MAGGLVRPVTEFTAPRSLFLLITLAVEAHDPYESRPVHPSYLIGVVMTCVGTLAHYVLAVCSARSNSHRTTSYGVLLTLDSRLLVGSAVMPPPACKLPFLRTEVPCQGIGCLNQAISVEASGQDYICLMMLGSCHGQALHCIWPTIVAPKQWSERELVEAGSVRRPSRQMRT